MTLQWIAIILGTLATAVGLVGMLRPELVKRVAEDHGGSVTLVNLEEGGAEAVMKLPIDRKAEA